MKNNGTYENRKGGKIYTLAQSETRSKTISSGDAFVTGKGTNINDLNTLRKRAKRKVISQSMILALVDVAKSKGSSERAQQYWNTYHCQRRIIVSKGKAYGKYCKNRFCTICCAIRKAELINKYYPIIKNWNDVQFLTLTVKAVHGYYLRTRMDEMYKAIQTIQRRNKQRCRRGKGLAIKLIRSTECNFNPTKKTFNPHFHLIIEGKEMAETIKKEWIEYWTTTYASPAAQYIRPVRNLTRDLIEVIKYGSKIFTEPDVNNKLQNRKKGVKQAKIYVSALDNIFLAMQGRRIFERYGFNLHPENIRRSEVKLLKDYREWLFSRKDGDWVDLEVGECLSNYKKSNELHEFLKNCIV